MTKALIIGGGIAGPVAAIALKRAGIASEIFEAYPRGADGAGLWLTLATNGLAALKTLDLHCLVAAKGFPTATVILSSGSGKRLGETPLGADLPDGTVSQTIRRADLYLTLRDEALRRGVRLSYGKRLVAATPAAHGGVVARFEDGSQAEGDVLIGCDGVHSQTRRLIDPRAPSPRHLGLINLSASTREAQVRVAPGAWRMVFGKRAFFGYAAAASGEIVWFANVPCAEVPSRAELSSITTAQWKRCLWELFAADHSPAADIIAASGQELVGSNTYDLPSVPRWHRERMIIIGDAAHAASPSSGQGAAMAIEDAVVLAQCLRDLPDAPQAFEAYERLRRERVERIVAYGARSSSSKTRGPIGRRLQDLILPFVLRRFATLEAQAWMFDYRIDWNAKVA